MNEHMLCMLRYVWIMDCHVMLCIPRLLSSGAVIIMLCYSHHMINELMSRCTLWTSYVMTYHIRMNLLTFCYAFLWSCSQLLNVTCSMVIVVLFPYASLAAITRNHNPLISYSRYGYSKRLYRVLCFGRVRQKRVLQHPNHGSHMASSRSS